MSQSPFNPIDQHEFFQQSARWFTHIAKLGCVLDLPETLGLVRNRPVVFAGNHRSLFDLVATMAIFDRFGLSCRIQVRADYMESGPGAKFLHGIGCIPTSSSTRVSAERTAIETIERGQLVALMPEGRLYPPHQWTRGVGRPKPGISRIALATDAVVIPVGFSGTEKVWPRGKTPQLRLRRPTVKIRVGPAIELASADHEMNAVQVMDGVSQLLEDMGDPHAS